MENPSILILDEPMNALDDKSVNAMRELLLKLRNEGKMIILTSHNKDDISFLCDKVLYMREGEIY